MPTYEACPLCTNAFSCFFLHSTLEEKKLIMRAIAVEANEMQREIVDAQKEANEEGCRIFGHMPNFWINLDTRITKVACERCGIAL